MSVQDQTFSRDNMRIFSHTSDVVRDENIDHVFSHSPSLLIFAGEALVPGAGGSPMSGRGKHTQTGGHAVVKRVRLGSHDGAKRGSGPFDTHNVAPDDNTRFAELNWKFYTHGLAVSKHDLRVNSGDAAIASFVGDQTQSVMLALADFVADDIHSTTSPANGLVALDSLISANDTVQGLNGQTYTKYNARGLSSVGTAPASVSFASGSFAAQGIADMRTSFNNASEGMIQPDVGITDYATHERYEGSLQPQERFAAPLGTGDAAFQGLAFRTKAVVADRKCASGYFYWLRVGGTDGITLEVLEGADFAFDEWKPSSNQNVMVRPLELTAALCIGNRQYGCNKMTSITD